MGVFTTGRQVALEILMPGWWLSGASVDLDFRNGRYYDSSVPNTVSIITSFISCSRASVGYAQNSAGTWISFTSDQLRITDLGLLIEDARTNNLLNSNAPATQTTASLATGTYTLWVEGSGSALASGGTATITGAASVTENNPNAFTVTVAGTVTITVTGTLTKFQLELGNFASSFILTTGAAATRAADVVTAIGGLNTLLAGSAASILVETNNMQGLGGRLIGSAPDTGSILSENSSSTLFSQTSGIINLFATVGGGATWIEHIKTAVGFDGSGRSLVSNNGTLTSDANTGFSATNYIIGGGALPNYGYFRRLTIWNSRLADATLQALTAP